MLDYIRNSIAHLFHPRRSNNHRSVFLHPETLLALAFAALIFAGGLNLYERTRYGMGSILGYASDISVGDVISLTNQERAKSGLAPLQANTRLSAAALAKGQDMFNNQYWAHTSPQGREPWDFMRDAGYVYRVAGENLARDFSTTPAMVSAWMASPTHRANIMNSRYNEIGIAVINGTLEGVETTLVVQMFGSPNAATAAVTNESAASTVPAAPKPTPAVAAQATPTPLSDKTTNEEQNEELVDIDSLNDADEAVIKPGSEIEVNRGSVLARILVPIGEINPTIIFSPLQLTKAFSLAIILMLLTVLIYDLYVTHHKNTVRLVGKNLGHILLFLTVAFLILFFRGGMVI